MHQKEHVLATPHPYIQRCLGKWILPFWKMRQPVFRDQDGAGTDTASVNSECGARELPPPSSSSLKMESRRVAGRELCGSGTRRRF